MEKLLHTSKKMLVAPATLALGLLAPIKAFADTGINNNLSIDCNDVKEKFGGICGANIGKLLGNVVVLIFIIAALLAFIFLIIGGVRWILSGGEKDGVDKAKKTITAAIIGLAVVFLSFIIINILGAIFHFSISNLQIPSLDASS